MPLDKYGREPKKGKSKDNRQDDADDRDENKPAKKEKKKAYPMPDSRFKKSY